jgi:nitric oxide reductase NorD protein
MPTTFSAVEEELKKLPTAVLQSLHGAVDHMKAILSEDELLLWAQEGLSISRQAGRSWEASVEYFNAGPNIVCAISFSSFIQWARSGTYLAQESPALAMAYFTASPTVVSTLRPQYIPRWASLGRSLYKGTWKSGTLAARFFDFSPELIRTLPFWDVEMFAAIIESISHKSHDVAIECLVLGQNVLSHMGTERESFLSMLRVLTDSNWREVRRCMETVGLVMPTVEETQRDRFLNLGERLAKAGVRDTTNFLLEGSRALQNVDTSSQKYIIDLMQSLLNLHPQSVLAFLKSLTTVLSRITISQLDIWFHHGARVLEANPESGLAFFRLESSTSERALETLSSSVDLERVRGVMRLYCRALSGEPIEILSSRELVNKGIGWVSESRASTDGTKVFLPEIVDRYANKEDNFNWFKVVSTHQVGHLEFGSFQFLFTQPSKRFKDIRLQREQRRTEPNQIISDDLNKASEENWATDMGRFFALFEDRRLALDIFTILEDGRLDVLVKSAYPGIATSYGQMQDEALDARPAMEEMPRRQALVELLVRLGLGQNSGLHLTRDDRHAGLVLARILKRLLHLDSRIEDSAEATLRSYNIISRLPNERQNPENIETQDLDDNTEFSDEGLEQLLSQLPKQNLDTGEVSDLDEDEYQSPEQVEFRGDFKPELVQMLSKLRSSSTQQSEGDGQQISREMLEQNLGQSAEFDLDAEAESINQALGQFAQNLMREAGVAPHSSQPGEGSGPIFHEHDQGGSLEAREPSTYTYDEWDFRASDYKPKWCIVRERTLEQGDAKFFDDALQSYSSLSNEIRRQFEMVIPETFHKVRRVIDGEDLDLDALIDAAVDRKAGVTPSEKIWWRRSKIQRDVAVVFLIDMSASTAEAIDEGRQPAEHQSAPDDPVEYMAWLRTRREGLARRHYKRIIDLEKESIVLLIQALESIGDSYGIYGFSGYGRENVEFYIIKDMDVAFNENVKLNVDKIAPMHATRMGPAIRHATTILERQEAKTKVLFLISDGRPQDRGYSREGVEKEYAVHDTHAALMEAKHKAMIPFCLTVDRAGHDYLKTMCGDLNYEVLDDIWNLPARLPQLYKRLTM